MRTSNKILTGLLLTTILVFCSLFTLVRVKYANGSTVKTDRRNTWSDLHRIKEPIKRVSISYLNNVMIIPSDSVRLEIWKDEGPVQWWLKDGVLYIQADSSGEKGGGKKNTSWAHIELFLPNVDSIYIRNGQAVLKNIDERGVINPVYNFQLDATALSVETHRNEQVPTFYDKIRVNAGNGSTLRFLGNLRVNDLEARLSGAEFEDERGIFGKLTIQTDSTSKVQIKGHNLRKATIISTE